MIVNKILIDTALKAISKKLQTKQIKEDITHIKNDVKTILNILKKEK